MTHAQARRERSNRERLARQLAIVADGTRPPRDRKRASRLAAAIAEKLGILKRPRVCRWCRRRVRLERHHPCHSRPLDIMWLCFDCHLVANTQAADGTIDGGEDQGQARMVG
jgi:hypothetical protein